MGKLQIELHVTIHLKFIVIAVLKAFSSMLAIAYIHGVLSWKWFDSFLGIRSKTQKWLNGFTGISCFKHRWIIDWWTTYHSYVVNIFSDFHIKDIKDIPSILTAPNLYATDIASTIHEMYVSIVMTNQCTSCLQYIAMRKWIKLHIRDLLLKCTDCSYYDCCFEGLLHAGSQGS